MHIGVVVVVEVKCYGVAKDFREAPGDLSLTAPADRADAD